MLPKVVNNSAGIEWILGRLVEPEITKKFSSNKQLQGLRVGQGQLQQENLHLITPWEETDPRNSSQKKKRHVFCSGRVRRCFVQNLALSSDLVGTTLGEVERGPIPKPTLYFAPFCQRMHTPAPAEVDPKEGNGVHKVACALFLDCSTGQTCQCVTYTHHRMGLGLVAPPLAGRALDGELHIDLCTRQTEWTPQNLPVYTRKAYGRLYELNCRCNVTVYVRVCGGGGLNQADQNELCHSPSVLSARPDPGQGVQFIAQGRFTLGCLFLRKTP